MLISHPKTVDQFPAELGDWGPALGDAERPEIQIYDVTVEQGSLILLAQSDWPQHVTAQSLAVAAAAPNVTLASQYLGQLAGNAELSALLVSFSSTIPELRDEGELLPAATPESKDADAVQTAAKVGFLSAAGKRLFGGRRQRNNAAAPPPAPVTQPAADCCASASPAGDTAASSERAGAVRPGLRRLSRRISRWKKKRQRQQDEGRSSGGRFWLVLALIVIPLLIIGLVAVMVFGRASSPAGIPAVARRRDTSGRGRRRTDRRGSDLAAAERSQRLPGEGARAAAGRRAGDRTRPTLPDPARQSGACHAALRRSADVDVRRPGTQYRP